MCPYFFFFVLILEWSTKEVLKCWKRCEGMNISGGEGGTWRRVYLYNVFFQTFELGWFKDSSSFWMVRTILLQIFFVHCKLTPVGLPFCSLGSGKKGVLLFLSCYCLLGWRKHYSRSWGPLVFYRSFEYRREDRRGRSVLTLFVCSVVVEGGRGTPPRLFLIWRLPCRLPSRWDLWRTDLDSWL